MQADQRRRLSEAAAATEAAAAVAESNRVMRVAEEHPPTVSEPVMEPCEPGAHRSVAHSSRGAVAIETCLRAAEALRVFRSSRSVAVFGRWWVASRPRSRLPGCGGPELVDSSVHGSFWLLRTALGRLVADRRWFDDGVFFFSLYAALSPVFTHDVLDACIVTDGVRAGQAYGGAVRVDRFGRREAG